MIRLACNEQLRMELGENVKRYLDEVVSWRIVVGQYDEAYELARRAKQTGRKVVLPQEF